MADALVSQVAVEDVALQNPDIRVSQAVIESLVLQDPIIRVSQVVIESVILVTGNVAASSAGPAGVGGMGCVPRCVPEICEPRDASQADRAGLADPLMLAGVLLMGILLEGEV